MTFVGQLNFAEISESLVAAGQNPPVNLPNQGILSFFYDMEAMSPGLEKHDDDYRRFYWDQVPQGDAPAIPVPNQRDAPFECRLIPSVRLCLPSPADDTFHFPDAPREVLRVFNELQVGILRSPVHQVLGHAAIIQNDPCSSASRFCPVGGEGREGWRVLWQIDTDEESGGFMWGDAGILYIMIRDDDLRNRRFDRLQYEWQCY